MSLAALWVATARAETVRVRWALDGDSLRLSDRREVRMIGINAPELGHNGAADQPLAAAAHKRLDELVRGRAVNLRYDVERFDRYGRTLAYAFLPDGRDVQEILLREGLVWFVAIAPNISARERYLSAEAKARAQRLGVWSLAEYEPIPAERLGARDTGFRLVTGTVTRVSRHQEWYTLRLAPDVELTLPHKHGWPLPPLLTGRHILARGWLTAYKSGLRMRITDRSMLEVLP